MKILFIGCVKSSYLLLEELLDNGKSKNICSVITKKSSNYNADFEDLAPLCKKHKIHVEYTSNINDPQTVDFIKEMNPDIIYCFGWSQLLSNEIIRTPKLGVVGFHPTKLPYNKGRHPIIWTLVLGLSETASTFFMIDEKADNGDIISQVDIKVDFKDDANTLYEKIMKEAKKQVIQFSSDFENGTVKYIEQDGNINNIWRKRIKKDGKIDFRMPCENIYNLVRGLTKPYIGAHFEYQEREYKVWRCEIVREYEMPYKNIEFGKVLKIYSPTSFLVRAGDFLIKVLDCEETDLQEGDYL